MSDVAVIPPARRPELLLRPIGQGGDHVVKDPSSGEYFNLGPKESFLLERLDGQQAVSAIREEYQRHFNEPLTEQDLDSFVVLAKSMGFLRTATTSVRAAPIQSPETRVESKVKPNPAPKSRNAKPKNQSILYWRRSLFNPDRLLTWMEPKFHFLFSELFVLFSIGLIGLGAISLLTEREALLRHATNALTPETVLLGWLTLTFITTCHEFAHGLTCKRFGGEVREMGFLLMFFTPCLYCNISDAWLIRDKSKRMLITLAGGYNDLLFWGASATIWRITMQDTLVNHLAFVVLTVSTARLLFNFNPLLRSDGYYLLSDLVNIPNLRRRGFESLAAHARWLLWGAPRPQPQPRGGLILLFGIVSWCFAVSLLSLLSLTLAGRFGTAWGPVAASGGLALGFYLVSRLFRGVSEDQVMQMVSRRFWRTLAWSVGLVLVGVILFVVPIPDRAGGSFSVRPLRRMELRSPIDAFVREVFFDEGKPVDADAVVARLEVPDLTTRVAQKEQELLEAKASLNKSQAELDYARDRADWAQSFRGSGAVAEREQLTYIKDVKVWGLQLEQANASVARLSEELAYLQSLVSRQQIKSPITGTIVTPYLSEKVGQYLRTGDVLGVVEESSTLEVQIQVPEQDAADLRVGQEVRLRARTLPFQTFTAKVERIAPTAQLPDVDQQQVQGRLVVYCRLDRPASELRPGMTGHAYIYRAQRPIGEVLYRRVLRYIRTEFW